MAPLIDAWSMAATSCGSVASGLEAVRNIRTIALWTRVPICCTIFAPSTSAGVATESAGLIPDLDRPRYFET